MSAEYVSKVIYDGTTLIDISQDNVDAAHLLEGYTAHGSEHCRERHCESLFHHPFRCDDA